MVNFEVIDQWITFLIGVVVACVTAYGAMRKQGLIFFPVQKIEAGRAKIHELTENLAACKPVQEVIGNIDPARMGVIITVVNDYLRNGYTNQELQDLGNMVIESIKTK